VDTGDIAVVDMEVTEDMEDMEDMEVTAEVVVGTEEVGVEHISVWDILILITLRTIMGFFRRTMWCRSPAIRRC
jgi:hypothetical protein